MSSFLVGLCTICFICLGAFARRQSTKRSRSVAQAVADKLEGVIAGDGALITWNQHQYRCCLLVERRGEGSRELLRISRHVNSPASYSVQASDALLDAVVSPSISAGEHSLSQRLAAPGYAMNSPSASWATAWLDQGQGRQRLHALLGRMPTRLVVRPRLSYCDVAFLQLKLDQSKTELIQLISALDEAIESARHFDPTFREPPGAAATFDNPAGTLLAPFLFMGTGALALLPLVGLSTRMPAHPAGAAVEWSVAILATVGIVSFWHERLKRSASTRDHPRSVYLGAMVLIVTGSVLWSIGLARPVLQWWSP